PYTRVQPACAGCHFHEDRPWNEVSHIKWQNLLELWEHSSLPWPKQQHLILPSSLSIRSKADLKKMGNELGFFTDKKKLLDISHCPLWEPELQQAFIELRPLLIRFPALRASFRLRRKSNKSYLWVDTSHEDTKKILLEHQSYLKNLSDVTMIEWGQKRKPLVAMNDGQMGLNKKYSELPPIFHGLNHQGEPWTLYGHIADFTQSSEEVNRQILGTMQKVVLGLDDRSIAYEFGCGIGNITFAIAPLFREYHAFEWDPFNAESFLYNQKKYQNHFSGMGLHLYLHRRDAANGLSISKPTLATGAYPLFKPAQTIVLNPARSGVGQFLQNVIGSDTQNIIYLSCYPESMLKDLSTLDNSWSCQAVFGFDPFLYSRHLEVLAIFRKA
ncbi:MAG: hypothetical protein N2Z70_06795, partial [Bdellovibrionaceae bacterium]|nr:hypothetical protein [Pseudobdellovibrionaceae bacterium]